MTSFLALVVSLLCLSAVDGLGFYSRHFDHFRDDFRHQKRLQSSVDCESLVQELNFTAKADNFDFANLDTFDQRYFVNDQYFDGTDVEPVVFLDIGGESSDGKGAICYPTGVMMLLAKKHNALVVSLEHRFFGKSYPYFVDGLADATVETLRLLSPQQAIADLANFIQNFEFDGKNIKHAKWVLFGGSYPGTLCAYMRLKHPDLTVGGVCSSAPLTPKMDYYEYSEVSEFALRDWNATAAENIQKACKELREMVYTDDGREKLNDMFGKNFFDLDNSTSLDGDANYVLSYVCGSLVYLGQMFSPDDFDKVSEMMTRPLGPDESSVNRLPKLTNWLNPHFELRTVKKFNAPMQDKFDINNDVDVDAATNRCWTWMTCDSAFGWYQTSYETSIFGNTNTLGSQIRDYCMGNFGPKYTLDYVQKRTEELIKEYGTAETYEATNVVLPNGAYDPWGAAGSYVHDETRHQTSIFIEKTSHCGDMNGHQRRDSKSLIEARRVIEREVDYFVESSSFHRSKKNLLTVF